MLTTLSPPVAIPDEDDVDDTAGERNRFIAAAERLLAQGDFSAFHVRVLCREAQLSTHRFYRHFEGKQDLLVALLQRQFESVRAYVDAKIDPRDPPVTRVRSFIDTMIGVGLDDRLEAPALLFARYWRVLLPWYVDEAESCIATFAAPLVEALTEGAARGDLVSVDPHADAQAVYHLIVGVFFDRPVLPGDSRAEVFNRSVVPVIERALGLPPRSES